MLTCKFELGKCKLRCECGQECPPNENPSTYLQQCLLFEDHKVEKDQQVGIILGDIYPYGRLGTFIAKVLKRFGLVQSQSCGCAKKEHALNRFSGYIRFLFVKAISYFFLGKDIPRAHRRQIEQHLRNGN